LREVAGTLTLRAERSTEQAVGKRLHRCTPVLSALLKQLLPLDELPALPTPRRFLACDGTTLEGPGAPSADDRLHLVMHWCPLRLQEGHISATKKGERLNNERLRPGAVMVAERGSGSYAGMLDSVCARGAEVMVRWNPPLPWYAPQEKSRAIACCAALQRQTPGTRGSLPVVVPSADTSTTKDKRARGGARHVDRMTAQEATEASQRVRRTHQKQPRKRSEKPRFLRQWVCVLTS